MNFLKKPFPGGKCGPVRVLKCLAAHWRSFVVLLVPLFFLPLVLVEGKEAKCGYVICVMAFYWMTEAIPLPVTSLIPIVMFPFFGILSTEDVCQVYFKETNVMFLGGVIMAIAIEHCNLHKRIALAVMLAIGTSPRRLLLGFMMTTMFLSMWICNAAATAMMTPIVIAVLDELRAHEKGRKTVERRPTLSELSMQGSDTFDGEIRRQSSVRIEVSDVNKLSKNEICYFLGVAYAANIGGTGTITGTSTNLTFKGIFESLFPNADGINFATWMQFNVPLMIFNTFLAWIWLQILYMGLFRKQCRSKVSEEQQNHVRDLIMKNYASLGPISYHEINVFCLFVLDVSLWFFRKPEFVTGWGVWFSEKVVKDATPAIAVVLLLFILPADLDFLKFDKKSPMESPALLNWKILRQKLPFGIILLLGGGFAISKASEVSGLSTYMGHQLEVVKQFSPMLILTIIVVGTTFATEISSNTAVANIFLPVLAKMCRILRLHPLFLMMPTTISSSYAFMLPVATPPNAIVVSASNMKTSEMMKAGIGMNLICVTSLVLCFTFVGVPMYDLATFPAWAESENGTFAA